MTISFRRMLLLAIILSSCGNLVAQTTDVQDGDVSNPAAADVSEPQPSDTAPNDEIATQQPDETPAAVYDKADVAWMLVSIAFVLMMTCPGLALFYGGLVRKKNILSVMMQCVFLMGLMSVVWAVVGYSLAFGGSGAYFGNFEHLLLAGVAPSTATGMTVEQCINDQIIVAFQGMFFIITPALICGAFAERMKFTTMAVFSVVWGLLIYCPIAHWVWDEGGWLSEATTGAKYQAIDFAGGLVVHISSGVSALVCAVLIGRRRGFPSQPMMPHNLTYTCIGTGLLWVGWFGFNGGSGLAADGKAVNALFATHLAASAGLLSWSLGEWFKHGKASVLGACSGAVAGLVCITPGAGSVTPICGILMGFAAGLFCFFSCTTLKNTFGYDDSLDAFGIHGLGGILGAILTGVFATSVVTGGESRGAIDGHSAQIVTQLVSVVAAVGFSAIGTFVILKILDAVMGLRVSEQQEVQGLDISQHGEEGYIFL